jgi:hypothetical protein
VFVCQEPEESQLCCRQSAYKEFILVNCISIVSCGILNNEAGQKFVLHSVCKLCYMKLCWNCINPSLNGESSFELHHYLQSQRRDLPSDSAGVISLIVTNCCMGLKSTKLNIFCWLVAQ